jgi:phage terminase large subunit-like protein
MTTWVPNSSSRSPDRLDALVWALTELLGRDQKKKTSGWQQPKQVYNDE